MVPSPYSVHTDHQDPGKEVPGTSGPTPDKIQRTNAEALAATERWQQWPGAPQEPLWQRDLLLLGAPAVHSNRHQAQPGPVKNRVPAPEVPFLQGHIPPLSSPPADCPHLKRGFLLPSRTCSELFPDCNTARGYFEMQTLSCSCKEVPRYLNSSIDAAFSQQHAALLPCRTLQ